jgi:hypothetical protein
MFRRKNRPEFLASQASVISIEETIEVTDDVKSTSLLNGPPFPCVIIQP